MTYRKYLKLSKTNFSVKDANKFASVCENHISSIFCLCVMIGFQIAGPLCIAFEDSTKHSEILTYLSIFGFGYLGFRVGKYVHEKNTKKWKELLVIYNEMRFQRCLELELPIVIMKGATSGAAGSHTYYYSAFLVPNYFEEQFLQFRRDDTCQKLEFKFILDKRSIPFTMKLCHIDIIKYKEIDTYAPFGIKPTKCL